jgi:hypothetical protein
MREATTRVYKMGPNQSGNDSHKHDSSVNKISGLCHERLQVRFINSKQKLQYIVVVNGTSSTIASLKIG